MDPEREECNLKCNKYKCNYSQEEETPEKQRGVRLRHTMKSTVELKISNSRSRPSSTQAEKKKLRYFHLLLFSALLLSSLYANLS